MAESIDIVIVYALLDRQELVALRMPTGSTAGQAVRASGLLQKYPDIDLEHNKLGVFGKLVGIDAPLRAGDRVAIYRPLIADPKEIRRQRAAAGKAMKRGGDAARQD